MKVKIHNKPGKPEKFTWVKHKKWIDGFCGKTIDSKINKRKRGKNAK
jgi:hypothetical protein